MQNNACTYLDKENLTNINIYSIGHKIFVSCIIAKQYDSIFRQFELLYFYFIYYNSYLSRQLLLKIRKEILMINLLYFYDYKFKN